VRELAERLAAEVVPALRAAAGDPFRVR
jgi:hypothetical protein